MGQRFCVLYFAICTPSFFFPLSLLECKFQNETFLCCLSYDPINNATPVLGRQRCYKELCKKSWLGHVFCTVPHKYFDSSLNPYLFYDHSVTESDPIILARRNEYFCNLIPLSGSGTTKDDYLPEAQGELGVVGVSLDTLSNASLFWRPAGGIFSRISWKREEFCTTISVFIDELLSGLRPHSSSCQVQNPESESGN